MAGKAGVTGGPDAPNQLPDLLWNRDSRSSAGIFNMRYAGATFTVARFKVSPAEPEDYYRRRR